MKVGCAFKGTHNQKPEDADEKNDCCKAKLNPSAALCVKETGYRARRDGEKL
jgi:hypothetical protein